MSLQTVPQDGNIGSGSHMGIVSFATIATADTGLITSTEDLKNVVDGLTAGGATQSCRRLFQGNPAF